MPADKESSAQRRAQPSEALSSETIKWLAALPDTVRPRSLPVEFARITNTLSRRWATRQACAAYLDELLMDRRGTRRGFPLNVVQEIATLKNYYETVVHPTAQTVWDDIVERKHD